MSSPELDTNEEGIEVPRRKSRPWRTVLSLATLSILAYLGWPYRGELHKLWEVDLGYLAAVLAMSMAARMVSTEVFLQTLAGIGCLIPRMEAFLLTILRGYSSLLVPRSGFGTTGFYLKKRYGVRYASYTALLFPIAIVQCLAIGLLGLGATWLLRKYYDLPTPPTITILFAGSSLAALVALLIRFRLPEGRPGRLTNFLRRFNEAWHELSRNRPLLLKLVALHTTGIFSRCIRLYLVFCSLGVTTNFWGVLVASLLADLAFIFSITPAGLGFREAAIVFGANLTGATQEEALAAAFLDRLVMIVTLVILAQVSLMKMPGIMREDASE